MVLPHLAGAATLVEGHWVCVTRWGRCSPETDLVSQQEEYSRRAGLVTLGLGDSHSWGFPLQGPGPACGPLTSDVLILRGRPG